MRGDVAVASVGQRGGMRYVKATTATKDERNQTTEGNDQPSDTNLAVPSKQERIKYLETKETPTLLMQSENSAQQNWCNYFNSAYLKMASNEGGETEPVFHMQQ